MRLTPAGFRQVYEAVRRDPDAAKAFAEEIDSDPRAVLDHLFRLTKGQQAAIANTSDAELRRRAGSLLKQLRSKAPNAMRFDPNATKPAPHHHKFTCTCSILEEV